MKMTVSTVAMSCELDYIMRRYHVYKDNWEPFIGETLDCAKETSNPLLYALHLTVSLFQFLSDLKNELSGWVVLPLQLWA